MWNRKPLHHVATLLDPRLKVGVLSAQEKDAAVVLLRDMKDEAGVEADTAEAAATSQLTEASQQSEQTPDPEQSPIKKGR